MYHASSFLVLLVLIVDLMFIFMSCMRRGYHMCM
jgi:hypothetical protein